MQGKGEGPQSFGKAAQRAAVGKRCPWPPARAKTRNRSRLGWTDAALTPGETYAYTFKIRDKSPQQNETPYSSVETVIVSEMTGYHDIPVAKLAAQAEGTLVFFQGKVTAAEADAYVVSADGATVKVMPRTVASATNPDLNGRDVTVKGCLWTCRGEKRVLWAEVK